MPYAAAADVAVELGVSVSEWTTEERDQVLAWIENAETVISARLGDLSELDPAALKLVIKQSVARRKRNPEGKINERIDDYSFGLSVEAAKASLYITDDEWAVLAAASGLDGRSGVALRSTPRPWHSRRRSSIWKPWAEGGVY